jgi:hypothetical protein
MRAVLKLARGIFAKSTPSSSLLLPLTMARGRGRGSVVHRGKGGRRREGPSWPADAGAAGKSRRRGRAREGKEGGGGRAPPPGREREERRAQHIIWQQWRKAHRGCAGKQKLRTPWATMEEGSP